MRKQSLRVLPIHVLDCLSEQSAFCTQTQTRICCCPLLQCSVEMYDSVCINNTVELCTADSRKMS